MVALVLTLVLALLPAPYVIEQPGPVFNTLGTDAAVGQGGSSHKQVPMISIPDRETSSESGSLDVLTVQVLGNPQVRPSWFQILTAWFDPSQAVQPLEALFPQGTTVQESDAENAALMANSQQDAIAAALNHLGYHFSQLVKVEQVIDKTPAAAVLKVGDEIEAVNGRSVSSIQQLQDAIATNGTEHPVQLTLIRSGTTQTVSLTPTRVDGDVIVGIGVGMSYHFPFTVTIQLNNVGGPSGGQMFALGIMSKLTPGGLTGGARIAGTGTIDNLGQIGPIGGIRQKMYAARDAGRATYFLAPTSNCSEVVGHIPAGLHVFAVSTLNDSLAVLGAIRSHASLASLPQCTAK